MDKCAFYAICNLHTFGLVYCHFFDAFPSAPHVAHHATALYVQTTFKFSLNKQKRFFATLPSLKATKMPVKRERTVKDRLRSRPPGVKAVFFLFAASVEGTTRQRQERESERGRCAAAGDRFVGLAACMRTIYLSVVWTCTHTNTRKLAFCLNARRCITQLTSYLSFTWKKCTLCAWQRLIYKVAAMLHVRHLLAYAFFHFHNLQIQFIHS